MPRLKTNPKTSSLPVEDSSNKKLPEKIVAILRFVYKNRFSDFYRKKFDEAGVKLSDIKTFGDFAKLPFVSKEDFVASSPSELLFFPPTYKDVDFVRFSSGTSGRGLSMAYRSSKLDKRHAKFLKPFFSPAKIVLVLLGSANRIVDQFVRFKESGMITLVADVHNLEAAALAVQKSGADAISTTPTLALLFTGVLKKYCDLKTFKVIYLHCEPITPLTLNVLKENYPSAVIFSTAGATEAGGIFAYQCPALAGREEYANVYHPNPDFYFEIVSGEIILTMLRPMPLTLVRYKTGDRSEAEEKKCECGQELFLRFLGRMAGDTIRAGGMEFKASALKRVAAKLAPEVQEIKLHLYEERVDQLIRPKIIFEVLLEKKLKPSPELENKILLTLKNNLWVSQHRTLFDVLREGFLGEPALEIRNAGEEGPPETKMLFDHRLESAPPK